MVAAAYMGVLAGLSLGPLYLAGGLGHAVEDHARAVRLFAEAQAERAGAAQAAQAQNLRFVTLTGPGLEPTDAAQAVSAQPARTRELDCLAQAVYFEARGETPRGQAAVATVIMNRVKNPRFPKTVCGVVYQGASHRNGCQFSFACDGIRQRIVEWDAWERARKVAARALSGFMLADIGKATYYHTTEVSPDWGAQMMRVAQVGLHVFYRFNPHARPMAAQVDGQDDGADALPGLAAADVRLDSMMAGPAAATAAPPAASVTPAKPPEPAPAGLVAAGLGPAGLAKTADSGAAPAKVPDAT
jgi:spore germination cell wall hydrolase CwlJ-like protein